MGWRVLWRGFAAPLAWGETTFICIDGNMARSDLEKLLAEQMEN